MNKVVVANDVADVAAACAKEARRGGGRGSKEGAVISAAVLFELEKRATVGDLVPPEPWDGAPKLEKRGQQCGPLFQSECYSNIEAARAMVPFLGRLHQKRVPPALRATR